MKLYTEEQVKRMMELARETYELEGKILLSFEPIKLPNDEDIEKEVTCSNLGLRYDYSMSAGFKKGAKWMRDKIQGGNK